MGMLAHALAPWLVVVGMLSVPDAPGPCSWTNRVHRSACQWSYGSSGIWASKGNARPGMQWKAGGYPSPLQGAQPMPSLCLLTPSARLNGTCKRQ